MIQPDTTEKAFEAAIEEALLTSGYGKRAHTDYDRAYCLDSGPLIDFLNATQPREWARYQKQHGAEAKAKLLHRIASEITKRGTLDVLRGKIRSNGCRFHLAYFPPNSGMNPETARRHQANRFTVIRQLRYSTKGESSLDMVLFLNGVPLFTAELKNPFSGQNVAHAVEQYRSDRDAREPLFAFGRCLAHFAVDEGQVYVATELVGKATRFLPFNRGHAGGAGNPPEWRPGTYASAYLWEDAWSPLGVLTLVQHFVHVVEHEDERGRKTGEKSLIFPRYQQRDTVNRLVADARNRGPGQRYLIQHSAGSGKSNTIAWLAHRLAVLHSDEDQRVFDSIVVVTDRRVLDRQLRRTVRQFAKTQGVVQAVEDGSAQLAEALEKGRDIIITTLQKFPFIVDRVRDLPGNGFAVIIDEAHSSQSGEASAKLKKVLDTSNLDAAEQVEAAEDAPNAFEQVLEDAAGDDRARKSQRSRKWPKNVSVFAFTATPKPSTLELFGEQQADGTFAPFSLYSMRQAIEEGFILDVLESYTTYTSYWKLKKLIADDPRFEKKRAMGVLKAFAERQEEAIAQKAGEMLDHFNERVAAGIGGIAKAMIVTRSRAHAVLFKITLDRLLVERGRPFQALVAFSGKVKHQGLEYTETGMNGFPESRTADTFKGDAYRLMVCANKFQTGFDQPLLAAMYVDKKLGGVAAVQTLSRLNRTIPGRKRETFVLDFANAAEEIQKAFQPYYERTLLSEATNPDLLHDLEHRIYDADFASEDEAQAFGELYFADPPPAQDRLYAQLKPIKARFMGCYDEERKAEFRGALDEYVRLYAFLSQIIDFTDPDLERLHVFGRYLLRVLPPTKRGGIPPELLSSVDLGAYDLRRKGSGKISLERGTTTIDPQRPKDPHGSSEDEMEELSLILQTLNERFGTVFKEEDVVFIEELESRVDAAPALAGSLAVNPLDTVKLTFQNLVGDTLQEMMDANFTLYQRVTDDEEFGKFFFAVLFERFMRRQKGE